MKKLLLLLSVSMGLGLVAQPSFIIMNINNTKTITPGSVIHMMSEDSVTTKLDFDFKNISNSTHSYKVKRYDMALHTVPGDTARAHFCFGGLCTGYDVKVSTSVVTLTPGLTASQYQASIPNGAYYILEADLDETQTPTVGYSYVKYTLFNDANANDSIQFAIKYNDVSAVGLAASEKSLNSLSIFPNPSSGATVLKLSASKAFNSHITVFNSLGQSVIEKEVSVIEGKNKIALETDVLPSGVYFVNMKAGEITITRKLIIN